MAVMIHPFGPKPHPLAEIIPINCTGCGICAMWCLIYKVRTEDCIGCRSCKVNCPSEAVILLPPKREV